MSKPQTDEQKRYFLPPDYKSNTVNNTLNDGSSDKVYWDAKRANSLATYVFQFPVYKYAAKKIAEIKAQTLIDVGCGVGAKLTYIDDKHPDLKIIGIDQKDAIEYCRKHRDFGEWMIDNFDAPDPDLDKIKGDLVLCCDVIEHVLEPDKLLNYLKSRVKPSGYIILSTPDRVAKYGAGLKKSGHHSHVREWSFDELNAYVKDRGFDVVEHFRQWPVKIAINPILLREVRNQIMNGNKIKYNQVCLLKVS